MHILGFRTFKKIAPEDIRHFLFIGFNGYFLSNAALMLGIQFSTGSFSSLINATSPVFITMFAVLILKERIRKMDILSLVLSILGAAIVIGSPKEAPAPFGVFCGIFSVVLWSYVTIHIKKLSEKYPPLEVTAGELTDLLIDRVLVYPDNRIEIAYKIKDIFD